MADETMTENSGGELHSWKEIADYLKTTARTAQRWETERHLPVRRLRGDRGRVVARVAEIEEWKRRDALQQVRPWNNPKWLRLYAGALTAILLVSAGILGTKYLSQPAPGPPSSFQWHDRQILVFDQNGQELWTHTFPRALGGRFHTDSGRLAAQYVDLNGDGKIETVITSGSAEHMKYTGELYCFSESGEVLWRFSAGLTIQDRGVEFYPPYHFGFLRTMASPESPRERWVVVTSTHHLSYPSQLVLLDARGRIRGEYWHPGHMDELEIADVDGKPGEETLAAGENRHEGKASVVILNPEKMAALPPTRPAAIDDNPEGAELAVLFFPRTRLNLQLEEINHVGRIHWTQEFLEVQVEEACVQRPSTDLNYVFDRSLNYSYLPVGHNSLVIQRGFRFSRSGSEALLGRPRQNAPRDCRQVAMMEGSIRAIFAPR